MSNKAVCLLAFVLAVSSVVAVLPVKAESNIIIVPDDYATIAEAIQHASSGDTISVKNGVYLEPTLDLNKSVSLVAQGDNVVLTLNPPLVEQFILRNRLWIPVAAVTIDADNVKLEGFTINVPRGDYGYGGGLHATGNRIQLVNNIIENNTVYLSGNSAVIEKNVFGDSLELVGDNQTIRDNIVKGLKLQGAHCIIEQNSLSETTLAGKVYLNGSFNLVSENTFPWLTVEENSNNNVILKNSFQNLVLSRCSDSLITKNSFAGNGGYNNGIAIQEGTNNIVAANTIRDCDTGLSLSGELTQTTVYQNNFVNNTQNIQYYGDYDWAESNRFDDGTKGNYYDDYKGADGNWDGVGDSPVRVEGTRWSSANGGVVSAGFAEDHYPLMKPVDIDSVAVDLPDWAKNNYEETAEPATPEVPILPVAAALTAIIVAVAGIVYYKKRDPEKKGLALMRKEIRVWSA
ncbi:MAG: right-handed parallel beta-helix repeat-containing protein [Candidatus Bathyarchaeia archaeon]|jgi:nitrous oxidase accessory protein